MTEEVEVFRFCSKDFDKDKTYEYALSTRTEGTYPNTKYYTTNTLLYLGRHVSSEEWGYGDNHGGAENFDNNGEKKIMLNYAKLRIIEFGA